MAERLIRWPAWATASVVVLVVVLIVVVGVAAAKNDTHERTVTGGRVGSGTVTSVPPGAAPPGGKAARGSTQALLAQLRIVDARVAPPGYSRDLFPTWLDLDGNGCDAREDTLIAESLDSATIGRSACEVVGGRWLSIYDGVETTSASQLDIDHLVPLAEAWRSGASTWETARRAVFANDLSFPDHLIAVTASMNRSKSDSPPQEWRPPRPESWCRYATAWVTVKLTWSLSATTPERDALGQMLDTC